MSQINNLLYKFYYKYIDNGLKSLFGMLNSIWMLYNTS